MAEAKNSFLKAKMNQDLDDRLLPNGEYRTAQNVLVGKSEEDSVGTLQNIKGNSLVAGTQLGDGVYGQIEIIGYYMDPTNNRIFTFATDWKGTEVAPIDAHCSIRMYNLNNGQYNTLVIGDFLNFSTQNTIIAVNLLEDLLFWTDNRNQPRKINVATAVREGVSHYYKENHISVAKYNPYQAISFVKTASAIVISTDGVNVIDVAETTDVIVGMAAVSRRGQFEGVQASEYIYVADVQPSVTAGQTTITFSGPTLDAIQPGDDFYFAISTMTDQADDPTWPGDPDYLEDKFVRFGYRFKFEDNEYSIYSPFTQIAFIPKQKGYFIYGDEENAISSTILEWFENNVNNIELLIPLPDKGANIEQTYKISEIDILYKESDSLAVKVLDTVLVSGIETENNFYSYSYQSRKPIRTLPQEQTTRVYDKVPLKAKAQEIISNRIVYGNFLTKPTPPNSISYTVNYQPKLATTGYPSWVEYPNHTVKQNRNYQVGFVLSDKFGRQSDVILSPVTQSTTGTSSFGGSTIYAEYITDDPVGSGTPDPSFMPDGVINWFGNSLVIQLNDPINGGTTGLYAVRTGDQTGFALDKTQPVTITDTTYAFTATNELVNTAIPAKGDFMQGEYADYVKITNVDSSNAPTYIITTEARVSNLYLLTPDLAPALEDIKYAYYINPLGWYSYKVVIKQIEQEYYNVYLPSAFAASNLVEDSTDSDATVSYVTLINDNINKIPRDLTEVGPDQKQYRSSVKLYGRVQPFTIGTSPNFSYANRQYFPFSSSDVSTAVGNASDLIGTPPENRQFSGIVYTGGSGVQTIVIKNYDGPESGIPKGAIVNDTDMTSVAADTRVIEYTKLGFGFNATIPSDDGILAKVFLNSPVSATAGNFVNFITRPGAYIFQGDSDPIIARISTAKQFGINFERFDFEVTSKPEDRFQLSVYETDPFISAIDIYWESAEYGLISSVNSDVSVGYDGPTTLEPVNFELFEDDPIGHQVTTTFYPLDQNGVAINETQLSSFTVTDGLGNTTGNGTLFTITQETAVGPNQYAYYITTSSLFAYILNSGTNNRYTFNIEFQNTNPSTEWEFQTLSFDGTLRNIAPSFTLPATPNYFIDAGFTAGQLIHDFGDPANNHNPVNGSLDTSLNTEDLYWTIASGNSQGYFSMDYDGKLKLTAAGVNAGNNTYPLVLRLQDAREFALPTDPGSLNFTDTINVIKGFEQTNFPVSHTPINSGSVFLNCNGQGGIHKDFVIYMSTFNYNNLPATFTFLPGTTFDLDILKTGPELQRGEFVWGMENWFLGPACSNPNLDVFVTSYLEVYKRQTDSLGNVIPGAQWVVAEDINGRKHTDAAQGVNSDVFLMQANNQSQNAFNWPLASYWAGNDPQYEYAFYVRISGSDAITSGEFVLRDLHYNGNNFEQVIYKFDVAGQDAYADSPLHEYNTTYFTDTGLINKVQVNPPGFGGNSASMKLEERLSSVTDPNNRVLVDKQIDWYVLTGGGGVSNNPFEFEMRGDATFDGDNDVDRVPNPPSTPPYIQTQKKLLPSGTFQVYTNSFPGPRPFNRGFDSSSITPPNTNLFPQ